MLSLLLFSCLAGVATALSPCILPILPFVLSSSVTKSRYRPLLLVIGFVTTFSLFTLFVSRIISSLGIAPSSIRNAAIVLIIGFGLTMIVPALGNMFSRLTSKLPNLISSQEKEGVLGALSMGAVLGLVWAPCAGPIFATIATLIATEPLSARVAFLLSAYAIGAAIPLLLVAYGGQKIISGIPSLARRSEGIRQGFGILTVIFGICMFLQLDTALSAKASGLIPESYTRLLSKLENHAVVSESFAALNENPEMKKTVATQSDNPLALPQLRTAPEISGISDWINSQPLALQDLKGKVVLIDFWTYSCINCVRTLPYLKDWYKKYHDKGLVIIGVHSPEFAFEKDLQNVQAAVKQQGLEYPIALDNNFSTWKAFKNKYWPAHYFIDAKGTVRHEHFGEGDYEYSEQVIQALLAEAGSPSIAKLGDSQVAATTEDDTALTIEKTPETYLGTDRQERFALSSSPSTSPVEYKAPSVLGPNTFTVSGTWSFEPEYAQSESKDAEIHASVSARDVYLVLNGPPGSQVRISTDAKFENKSEADSAGIVSLSGSRLYHIVGLPQHVSTNLTIQFLNQGIQAYAFTFG